jgi:hypothetical membrane protein
MVYWRKPGFFLMMGGLETLFMVQLAEILYPGYSVSQNFISDLGVGPEPSRILFTVSVILFGILALVAAVMMWQEKPCSILPALTVISAIGAIGVGLFNEHSGSLHTFLAGLAFGFGNMAALYTYRSTKAPVSYVCMIMGFVGLGSLILIGMGQNLGLGVGGIERMTFYPVAFWTVAFGAYMTAKGDWTACSMT